jgi:glucose dehydrogenase
MKYSPIDQITAANVTTLKQDVELSAGGAAPIVIDNVMYLVADRHVVALRADSGSHDSGSFRLARRPPAARFAEA